MKLDDTTNQILSSLNQWKLSLIDALPNILAAFIVLIVGWVLASVLRRLVRRVFRRLAAQIPSGTGRAAWSETVDDSDVGKVAAGGVYWLVLLISAMVAIDALDIAVLSRWVGAFASYLPRLAIAAALLFIGLVAGRLARNAIVKTAVRLPASQARGLGRFVQLAIVIATGLVAAERLGLDVSLLSATFMILVAATLAAAALAFGFGARDVVADILAMHYVNKSHRIGQLVRLGPDQGRIVRTGRTAVSLETAEGEMLIPGREFMNTRCVLLAEEVSHGA
ncbi:MAG: mechanosensitive ion channel [Deltaproteobacteria bacterium]|nr:mechanosensitive ion channel [Deltaproteobacteria bacterium]MBT8464679.1 mechanosensitive ion channel [Deltaproteobacteria bacterium]NND27829.1 mechanosensitive ion channel [Myxococcales bacterium]NNK06309.1 mechanosensitive ion channel [Myxococcales bacterium]NNK42288.1 mechanosensitive ion channel [Myxococcales bacterium]